MALLEEWRCHCSGFALQIVGLKLRHDFSLLVVDVVVTGLEGAGTDHVVDEYAEHWAVDVEDSLK